MTVAWVIQADDLTGAADTAVGFAAAGLPTAVLPWRDEPAPPPPEATVLAFDTASRDLGEAAAAARAASVARWFAAHCDERAWLYKKLDSTLRGHPAAELAAVERALSDAGRAPAQVVVAPAFPAMGRTTSGGRQRWDDGSVDVAARLGAPGAAVVDAESDEDLAALAERLATLPERPLLVGSGGLAAAFAARLDGSRPAARAASARAGADIAAATAPGAEPAGSVATASMALSRGGPVLVVSGSRTETAARQVAALARLRPSLVRVALGDADACGAAAERVLAEGRPVLLTGPEADADGVAGALGRAAARALARTMPALVVATGGATAHAVCSALGIAHLWGVHEAAPGAPLLHAALPDGATLNLIVKSGSFGGDAALADLVAPE